MDLRRRVRSDGCGEMSKGESRLSKKNNKRNSKLPRTQLTDFPICPRYYCNSAVASSNVNIESLISLALLKLIVPQVDITRTILGKSCESLDYATDH